jgi:hypothetical protein
LEVLFTVGELIKTSFHPLALLLRNIANIRFSPPR